MDGREVGGHGGRSARDGMGGGGYNWRPSRSFDFLSPPPQILGAPLILATKLGGQFIASGYSSDIFDSFVKNHYRSWNDLDL